MEYGKIPFEKRIKENIRNYRLENLFPMGLFQEYFKQLTQMLDVDLLITDRHGEKVFSTGNFQDFTPDVLNNPGQKLKVENRTVGHLYCKYDRLDDVEQKRAEELLDLVVSVFAAWGCDSYRRKEDDAYLDELEAKGNGNTGTQPHGEREDVLTGVFNKSYFESRMQVIDRAEIVPVAVINANINDWKFVNDHFGEEESDRLITVIAGFLREEAKADYVIGRTDGDVFHIIIPIPEADEAEDYCQKVTARCNAFEDARLAPSVAFGCVCKENVEEKLMDKLSDAEYEMFAHKMEMKQAPGYRDRLEKGIK